MSGEGSSVAAVWVNLAPGTPERGLWCPRCLLPSAVRIPLSILAASGVCPCGAVTVCSECSAQL